jgi:hypothetical protein
MRNPSYTKTGPGREHRQGRGHKMTPATPEKSALHPDTIAANRAALEARYRAQQGAF